MKKCTVVCYRSTNGFQNGETAKGEAIVSLAQKLFDVVDVISTEGWKKHPVRLLQSLKKSIKTANYVFLVLSVNGAKYLGNYLIHYCHKRDLKVFYFMVGIGPLRYEADRTKDLTKVDFQKITNYFQDSSQWRLSKSMFSRVLPNFDHVFVESDTIKRLCETIYRANNVSFFPNFRPDESLIDPTYWPQRDASSVLRLVYFARITQEKGVLELVSVCRELHDEGFSFTLDIFGSLQMPLEVLKGAIGGDLEINYKGAVFANQTLLLSKYDALVFPTKSFEGMPGTLTESMLAGTPVITSQFTFADDMVRPNETGFIFPLGNYQEMKHLLKSVIENPQKVRDIRKNCYVESLKYLEKNCIAIVKKQLDY